MPVCERCGQKVFPMDLAEDGICLDCHASSSELSGEYRDQPIVSSGPEIRASAAKRILLTTESAPNLPIAERLDIITAEVVIGMHLFRDIASAFRDTFGGRSATMQQGLRDARKTALDELRREALALGADAVVAVDLDYSEISGGGKSMLFLVASGTAVKLATTGGGEDRA